MKARLKQPPEVIRISLTKKAKRLHTIVVHRELALECGHVQLVVVSVDKGADKLALVKEVNRLWRSMNKAGIAGMKIIRCNPFGKGGDQIEERKHKP